MVYKKLLFVFPNYFLNFNSNRFFYSLSFSSQTFAQITCTTTLSSGANVSSAISSATAGSIICLSDGNYGGFTLNGVSKNPRVIVQAINSGQANFTSAVNLSGGTNGITIDGANYTGVNITGTNTREITLKNGDASNGTIQIDGVTTTTPNILFESLTSIDQDNSGFCRGGTHPCVGAGGYWFSYSGRSTPVATIHNATIRDGCADGVQSGVPFILEDSYIANKIVGSCPNDPHTDATQLYGGPFSGTIIRRNFYYSNVQVLTAYDGVDGVLIEDNVFDPGPSGERRPCQIELYADNGSIVRHNTLIYRDASYPGYVCLDKKSGASNGINTVVEGNIIPGGLQQNNGSTASVYRYNMMRSGASGTNFNGSAVFVGGGFPTTYAGFELLATSPGNNASYDGLDVGIRTTASTPDTTPPTLPSNFNLAANATSSSSITISWTAATDNIAVTNYQVERCLGLSCSTFTQVGTPTSSPFTDSGLTASTGYSYHVRAVDAAGNVSGWSNVVGATTQAPDTTSPSTPATLQASASSSSTIDLTWTASTDNVGVTGYKVERCSGSGCTTFTQVGTPTTNSYSDTALTASTTYRYRVRATDAAGNNSSYSSIAQASTPEAPPSPTFVSEYETPWNTSSSPKTTSNFSVQSGDTLVAYAVNEDGGQALSTPPTGTLQGTWTLQQSQTAGSYTGLRLWTMQVSSNQTNVNVSFSNGGNTFGGDVLHFRNTSGIGVTAQANNSTGNPSLTLTNVQENSTIVMVNGDWSAKTGTRTYNTTSAGSFTETSYYADGSSYGVEAGYYANADTSGNKTIGLTAPTGMKWAIAAVEIKGSTSSSPTFSSCSTVTPTNFTDPIYTGYGAPYDVFASNTPLISTQCSSTDTHTLTATLGIPGDTTRIVYTKGYYYDPGINDWTSFTGTCTGALNGEWCQGSVSASVTNANISTASATDPAYVVGFTCSVQGGQWRCGCRDTTCSTFYWQVQGAGM